MKILKQIKKYSKFFFLAWNKKRLKKIFHKRYLKKEELQPTKDNEFYFHDLEGLDVIDNKNEKVGKVISVVNFGAGDLLEILFHKSKKNEFFRFTEQNFPIVNIKEKVITIKS